MNAGELPRCDRRSQLGTTGMRDPPFCMRAASGISAELTIHIKSYCRVGVRFALRDSSDDGMRYVSAGAGPGQLR